MSSASSQSVGSVKWLGPRDCLLRPPPPPRVPERSVNSRRRSRQQGRGIGVGKTRGQIQIHARCPAAGGNTQTYLSWQWLVIQHKAQHSTGQHSTAQHRTCEAEQLLPLLRILLLLPLIIPLPLVITRNTLSTTTPLLSHHVRLITTPRQNGSPAEW
jgi:hypothetical protein